jgi:hypothetical protein
MRYLRSAAAVLGGFLLTAALVVVVTFGAAFLLGLPAQGPPTPLYLVLNLTGSALAGVAGGYLCARTAPRSPAAHAMVLALLVFVMSVPAVFSQPLPGRPVWYPAVLALLGPGSVLVGGWLLVRRSRTSGRSAQAPAEHLGELPG